MNRQADKEILEGLLGAPPDGSGDPLLVKYGKLASPHFEVERSKRYWLRNGVARSVTADKALAACGFCRRNVAVPVALVSKEQSEGRVTAWENLQTCGKVWLCPVCSSKIRAKRASEIAAAGVQHLASGGGLLTMAHTFPHDASMPLDRSWTVLAAAYRAMCSGKASVQDRERYGVLGHVKAYEVTVGRNGWHPHGHSLWFTEVPVKPGRVKELNNRLFNRFSSKVQGLGYGAPLPTYNRMEAVRDLSKLAVYVAKAANELARFDVKQGRGNRTPFQLLEDLGRHGDCEDLNLWHEWERGSRSKASIRWTPGLKGRFKLEELTDEEIAGEQVEGEEVQRYEFIEEEWNRVRRIPGAQALLMRCIEQGGGEAVASALVLLAGEAEQVGLL